MKLTNHIDRRRFLSGAAATLAAASTGCSKLGIGSEGEPYVDLFEPTPQRLFQMVDPDATAAHAKALNLDLKGDIGPFRAAGSKPLVALRVVDSSGSTVVGGDEGLALDAVTALESRLVGGGLSFDPFRTNAAIDLGVMAAIANPVMGVALADENNMKVQADLVHGKVYRNFPHLIAGPFFEGLAPALDLKSRKYGYTDTNGDFKIPPKFPQAGYFKDGAARVVVDDGSVGCIDTSGKLVFGPGFRETGLYINGWLAFGEGGSMGIRHRDGRVIKISNTVRGKWKGGDVFLADSAEGFFGGIDCYAANLDGKVIQISGRYSTPLPNGFAMQDRETKKWVLADRNFKLRKDLEFEEVGGYTNRVFCAKQSGLWGLMEIGGTWRVKPKYSLLEDFHYGWAAFVDSNGRDVGFVDETGAEHLRRQISPAFEKSLANGVIPLASLGRAVVVENLLLSRGGREIGKFQIFRQ